MMEGCEEDNASLHSPLMKELRKETGGTCGRCETEERRMIECDYREEQIDFLLPELCFLFRIAGIPVKKNDPIALNVVVFMFMWTIEVLMAGVYIKHVFEDDNPHFSHLVEVYWAFHSCIIYTMLSYTMHKDCQVFQMILLSAESEQNEWRCSLITTQLAQNHSTDMTEVVATSTQKKLRNFSRMCVFIVIISVFFNLSMLIATRFDIFLSRHLPWSDSDLFNVMGVLAWYFYSFHWFVAVICVYLPIHFFSSKVKYFIYSLENCLTLTDRDQVIRAMEWYDDLYKVNKLMNFESISLLTTTTLLMLMLLLIALLLSVVKDPDALQWPVFFWIITNSVVISCVSYTVAELETANKKYVVFTLLREC